MVDITYNFDDITPRSKCVFTNGCFDILHSGHIELFKFCKSQGTWRPLVIGVNSDASIRQLKGPSRPVMKEDDRLAVLSSIRYVDHIVVFHTKSVLPVIERLRPHILVKGGNYSKKACAETDRIVGEKCVESYGGKVMTAPLIEGVSTTTILERIKNENAYSR